MATTRQTLKDYFKKYATPTEAQFAALIDSFVHKDEDSLTQEKIDGLTAALNDKVSSSELQSAVEAAVAETLQDGNIEITPAAHEHAVSDISGLGDRLGTLETSKADYEAFKTLVTAFLNDADVSDTTINRWKELEDFLSGITDSDTLAGMLQALKAEILAEVPQPQTGNYLEQVTDMAAALQTAEVGKIVQYVGQSDAEYTRGLCYEKVEGASYPQNVEALELRGTLTSYGRTLGYTRTEIDPTDDYDTSQITDRIFLRDGSLTLPKTGTILLYMGDKESPEVGDTIMPWSMYDGDVFRKVTSVGEGITANNIEFGSTTSIPVFVNGDGIKIWSLYSLSGNITTSTNNIAIGVLLPDGRAYYVEVGTGVYYPSYNKPAKKIWQPIVTSPTVS